jgi:hypothetical protein
VTLAAALTVTSVTRLVAVEALAATVGGRPGAASPAPTQCPGGSHTRCWGGTHSPPPPPPELLAPLPALLLLLLQLGDSRLVCGCAAAVAGALLLSSTWLLLVPPSAAAPGAGDAGAVAGTLSVCALPSAACCAAGAGAAPAPWLASRVTAGLAAQAAGGAHLDRWALLWGPAPSFCLRLHS